MVSSAILSLPFLFAYVCLVLSLYIIALESFIATQPVMTNPIIPGQGENKFSALAFLLFMLEKNSNPLKCRIERLQ